MRSVAITACVIAMLGTGCSDQDDHVAGPPDATRHDAGLDAPAPDATLIHEPSGLPCDVAAVLANECTVCHTRPPQGGAPVPLLTREDLMAPAPGTTMTMAQYAVQRMMNGSMPQPPSTPATMAEIATMQRWIAMGMPAGTGSCPPASVYDGMVRCSSGTTWTQGNDASPDMHPGRACIACHTTWTPNPPDPVGTMAGTVYRTVHEPDDCNGVAASTADPITVTVLDIDGHVVSAVANGVSGNFFSSDPIHLPIQQATVTYQGRTRVMASGQPSADCNSCHTEGGTLGAPGRIVVP